MVHVDVDGIIIAKMCLDCVYEYFILSLLSLLLLPLHILTFSFLNWPLPMLSSTNMIDEFDLRLTKNFDQLDGALDNLKNTNVC